MSLLFKFLTSFLLLLGYIYCEDHMRHNFVGSLDGKSYIDLDSIGGTYEGEKPVKVLNYNKITPQSLVTEDLEYSTTGYSIGIEEKDGLEFVIDHQHPTEDTLVNGESNLDRMDTTVEGKSTKYVNSLNIDASTKIATTSPSSLKCASLLKRQKSETESFPAECLELIDNLDGKVAMDESITDSFQESYFNKYNIYPVSQDFSNEEKSTDSKRVDILNYKLKNQELFESSSLENFHDRVGIVEPTFATTDLSPTTTANISIEISQVQPDTEIVLIDPEDEIKESEKNLTSLFNSKISSTDLKDFEKQSEKMPYPEKLFAYSQERNEPGNGLSDGSSQRSTVPQPLQDKEELDKYYSSANDLKPGTLFENCRDCDIGILPITPLGQRSTPTSEEESLPSSKIIFADLPEGREIQISSLGLSNGIFLFSYISEFLSWIQPNDFPVELLRDALKNEMSWVSLITQSLRVEVGFVACLVAGVLLALAVPIVVLSHACYRMGGRSDDCGEDSGGWAGNCRRRTLVFILQLLLVLLCTGMVGMFVTNEQLSSAVVQSSEVVQTALSDVSTFIHNSHLQLHFLLTQSLDQTLQAVFADLENVDALLGRPIQKELVRETGLDVALESLGDMTKEAKTVTQQVERFMEEVRTTQDLLMSSRDKLSDLRQQVELFRRACGPRDRTMCDSIDASGLEITFKLDKIKTDERLNRMRRMGGVGLELAVSEAKDHFQTVPAKVEADTREAREDVRRLLTRQRAEIDEHTFALERLSRDLTSKVGDARFQAGYWTQDLDRLEYWRWIICMGGGVAVLMIWTMLLCSMCCGCCGSEKAAGPTILVTIVLLCLFSTALWTLVMVGLLVGGHSEVFLCRPLYDEPEFNVLSKLVDEPGVFYKQSSGGFIGNVIYGNNSIDVPVKNVLQECRDGRPVYPALGLHRVMDVESAVGQARWGEIKSHLRGIRANLSNLEVFSPVLSDQLTDLLLTLSTNFTEHRIQMSRPVTGKDLDSFAKQLDNIGNQLRDLATASRIETLSSRTRRLIDSHIHPLESRKDALVYQLTALEVQTQPLQRQVNQSMSHLKTIQFFINSQGESIAQRKSRDYVDRLMKYVDQLQDHVIRSAKETVAPCTPLWDIFNNSRLFLCKHTIDPLNGYWFATMWCLLILLVATPVCLKLVDYYRVQGARSAGSPSENLMNSEQGGGWSTPGYDIKCSKEHH